jgi:hypothetical protein
VINGYVTSSNTGLSTLGNKNELRKARKYTLRKERKKESKGRGIGAMFVRPE